MSQRRFDIFITLPASLNPDLPDTLSVGRSVSFNLDKQTVSGSMDTALVAEFMGALQALRVELSKLGIKK